ncbi:BAP_1a_G0025540.mRNA.1.CDS.1 [Saccharomyces cerevisiae]|nr:BAP_1a_G0025540.mRNA.1.CDS.1 [Saccharomyces cerevisiae]CAI7076256.1 BAP_1a_G0025540.mRNA.1.CDS.1 [Saccharomyces cerevisiae]
MPIIGVPRCLMKPFSVPVTFPFSVKKNIRILDLDPRTEAYCLSLNSVCFKRLPRKKYFHLLKPVQDSRRVLGVVYC